MLHMRAIPVSGRRARSDSARMKRPLRGGAALLAGVSAGLLLASALSSTAAATPSDPAGNRSLSASTYASCAANPSSSACISSALADINAARAAEGVPAMVLPSGFRSMSVPEQLLNLANLERTDRGLVGILGLSAALNQDAQVAAAQDRDPMPAHLYGEQATSNWAGGFSSSLEADFAWMYDDGPGSGNLDCSRANQAGCWGHRHDILWPFAAPLVMGAGYATGADGPSMTELFVGGDTRTGAGQPDAPVVRPTPSGAGAADSGSGTGTAAVTSGSGSAGISPGSTGSAPSTRGKPPRRHRGHPRVRSRNLHRHVAVRHRAR